MIIVHGEMDSVDLALALQHAPSGILIWVLSGSWLSMLVWGVGEWNGDAERFFVHIFVEHYPSSLIQVYCR